MNNPFEIKVCGINDEISMNTALKCKADYVGLVFYPNSPRNVSINSSRELLKLRNKIMFLKIRITLLILSNGYPLG